MWKSGLQDPVPAGVAFLDGVAPRGIENLKTDPKRFQVERIKQWSL
jgi:hypothetical protein